MRRIVNPSFMFLHTELVDWNEVIEAWLGAGQVLEGDLPTPSHGSVVTVDPYRPTFGLRWYTHPTLGLSRRPFELWLRSRERPPLTSLGLIRFRADGLEVVTWWGEHMAVIDVHIDVWGPVTVRAEGARFHDSGTEAVDSTFLGTNGRHTVTLRGAGLRSVVVEGPGAVVSIDGATASEYANLPGWRLVEVAGLPVDRNEAGPYEGLSQGPAAALGEPIAAALQRLARGAPRFGWPPRNDRGVRMPTYRVPDLGQYVDELRSTAVKQLIQMLALGLPTQQHEQWYEPQSLDGSGGTETKVLAHPLVTALTAAAGDPLAALALGYGTAWDSAMFEAVDAWGDPREFDVMLTLRHERFDDAVGTEFAALAFPRRTLPPQEQYWPFAQASGSPRPPTVVDGPYRQTVDLRWPHPPRRSPRSFALAEAAPGSANATLVNRERPSGGWVPTLAAGKRGDDVVQPLELTVPLVGKHTRAYSVAASDPFGRWTPWRSTDAIVDEEVPQAPTLIKARIELGAKPPGIPFYSFPAIDPPDGRHRNALLAIDFTWDWSLRTPGTIAFSGAFFDPSTVRKGQVPAPAGVLDDGFGIQPPARLEVRFQGDRPVIATSGCVVQCRSPDWTAVVDPGAPQQGPSGGVRGYRLYVPIRVSLLDRREVGYRVWALGTRALLAVPSGWTEHVETTVPNPRPPSLPTVREAPQWASLPDGGGLARARLQWTGPTGGMPVDHYMLFEASETALRDAGGLEATTAEASFADRIAALRGLDMSVVRRVFTRVDAEPIRSPACDVVLPRGTRLIHMYVVISVSTNKVEAPWPTSSKAMTPVAVPHRAVPDAPTLELRVLPQTGKVRVTVRTRKLPPLHRVELLRTDREPLSYEIETMGRPIGSSLQPGWTATDDGDGTLWTYEDDPPGDGFRSLHYRALAWSVDDDATGARAARSLPSPRRSIVKPPANPPVVVDPTWQRRGNRVELTFESDAPPHDTALGPHRLRVLVRSPDRVQPVASHESVLHRARVQPSANLGELVVSRQNNRWRYALALDVGSATGLTVTIGLRDPIGRNTTAVAIERTV